MGSKISSFIIIFFLLLLSGALVMMLVTQKQFGYVATAKVFEEFKLKKELENDYKKVQVIKQSYLDSIKLVIQRLSDLGNNLNVQQKERIAELQQTYLIKETQFNKENENLYTTYNEQIWKQLNQYIEDYGKENGFDYLLGANGQGNIMYAGAKEDCTKEIIEYVNTKYRGRK